MAVGLSFLSVIVGGTILLMMPWAQADGVSLTDHGATSPSFLDALFTATSATSLTGLITVDTATQWSIGGQIVIVLLIQIGGLGCMTLTSIMGLVFFRRLGLRHRIDASAEQRGLVLGEVTRVVRATVVFTLLIEVLIFMVLALRYHCEYAYSWEAALWHGLFHAVSAFNNAGFALYTDGLISFARDPWILLTLAGALIMGGLGFPVLLEFTRHIQARLNHKQPARWSLTARFTLLGTAILIPLGTLLVACGEWNGALSVDLGWPVRILNAFFAGVSPRTAGFNAVDYAHFSSGTLFGTDLLMIVGGGSGGTAGGVKITTVAVIIAAIVAEVRGDNSVAVAGRTLGRRVIRQALAVLAASISAIIGATFIILFLAPQFTLDQILFEVVSAFGTVGLSTGITAQLPACAQLILIVLMFAGRVGILALVGALTARSHQRLFDYPEERPFIG